MKIRFTVLATSFKHTHTSSSNQDVAVTLAFISNGRKLQTYIGNNLLTSEF